MKALLGDLRVRTLGLLWLSHLFVAGISIGPLMQALRGVSDVALSSEGGVLLLELLRIKRTELMSGLRESLLLLLVGQLLLVLVRARLTESIAAPEFGDATTSNQKRRLVFVVLSILFSLIVGLFVAFVGPLSLRWLDGWDGSLHPKQVVLPVLSTTLLGAFACGVLVIGDSVKLSIFAPQMRGRRLEWLLRLWRANFPVLLLARLLRGLFQLVALAVGLGVFIAPQALAASFPILSGFANQLLVFSVLSVEALWLHFVAKRMRRVTEAELPFAVDPPGKA